MMCTAWVVVWKAWSKRDILLLNECEVGPVPRERKKAGHLATVIVLLRLSVKFRLSLNQQDIKKQCNPKRFISRLWPCENLSLGGFWKSLSIYSPAFKKLLKV